MCESGSHAVGLQRLVASAVTHQAPWGTLRIGTLGPTLSYTATAAQTRNSNDDTRSDEGGVRAKLIAAGLPQTKLSQARSAISTIEFHAESGASLSEPLN